MAKKDEGGGFLEAPVETGAAWNVPATLTVEEHAKTLNVSAPVFAAVRQYKGWAAGKKIERSEFEKAVNAFLNAPMGGK
jgi:hypothetical protein